MARLFNVTIESFDVSTLCVSMKVVFGSAASLVVLKPKALSLAWDCLLVYILDKLVLLN